MKTGVAESNHDGRSPLGLDIRGGRGRAGRGPCQHMFAAHENLAADHRLVTTAVTHLCECADELALAEWLQYWIER
jgi:hypothetical protein